MSRLSLLLSARASRWSMVLLACVSAGSATACVHRSRALATLSPPTEILGDFQDDYDNHFRISATEWVQLPHGRFHVVSWDPRAQYFIARNDSANASAPGRWSRIDWMWLPGMAPYAWGFCLAAYDKVSRAEAERTTIARRETPKIGCNGFPFSRMRRVDTR